MAIRTLSLLLFFICTIANHIHHSDCVKILAMAPYYYSHAVVVASVGAELNKRGHTVIMPLSSLIRLPQELNLTVDYYPSQVTQEDLALCTTESIKTGNPFLESCVKYLGIELQTILNNTALMNQLKGQGFGKSAMFND